MSKECAECRNHSTMIELHEKRLDANNIEHKEIKDSMKLKVSRWLFVWIVGFVFGGMVWHGTVLHEMNAKVAVLYDRATNKDTDKADREQANPEKTAFLITR